jgi:hypothetical protein
MSARVEDGISQVVSSIRLGSDIEDDPSAPDAVLGVQAKPVQRHRLDQGSRLP